MNPVRGRKQITFRNSVLALAAGVLILCVVGFAVWNWFFRVETRKPLIYASTVAGLQGEFGEAFGVATRGDRIYVSDGANGEVKVLSTEGTVLSIEGGFDTPSGLAFDEDGKLLIADAGRNAIYRLDPSPSIVAGNTNQRGLADSDATSAQFNGPMGIAVLGSKIFIADTYNDRIRVIENGKVTTLAGSTRGFMDGAGESAKFDTPSGISVWGERLLVADTGNRRIRVVEKSGEVWTLAGTGEDDGRDGVLLSASFVGPTAIAFAKSGEIFVADGNSLRMISGEIFPTVTTITATSRGFADGNIRRARFNRPSGITLDRNGDLIVADAENRVVRKLSTVTTGHVATADERAAMFETAEQFRALQPGRWPFDPPTATRDIAGTLGEVRGEIKTGNDQVWFHNGLDIAGAYGETARFVRDEKVLRPVAADNFGTLRELIRMPTLGYIHVRLGRNSSDVPFGDPRFVFDKDGTGKLVGVRVPRGASFKAGEPIGTLNAMNHVHLIAGRSGSEMNALAALDLPGISDSRPPTIEKARIVDDGWRPLETKSPDGRILITGGVRVLMQAFDQMDGNADRRRLGLDRTGYQILRADGVPATKQFWTISFERLPDAAAVPFVYAEGSKSGATGETIFDYIVTNKIDGSIYKEDLLDTASLDNGNYTLRVFAADHFGNISHSDIAIEVKK